MSEKDSVMKKLLALLAVMLAALGIWGAYRVLSYAESDAAFYAEKVNRALEENEPQQAFDYINLGIEAYPDHLDLRFGKVYMCQMIADYDCMGNELIKILDYSAANDNRWKWLKEEDRDRLFMLGVVQNYQKILWEDNKTDVMRRVAETVLRYYPDHVESLNTMAVSYLSEGDWQNAESYLQTARQLAPEDNVVQANLKRWAEMKEEGKGKN